MVCLDLRYKTRRDGKFWFAECLDYPVFTQGRTKNEARQNLREAFLLYAEDSDAQNEHPELKRVTRLLNEPVPTQPVQVEAVLKVKDVFAALSSTYEPFTYFIGSRTGQNPV